MSRRLSQARLIIFIALLSGACVFAGPAEAAPGAPVLNAPVPGNARVDLSWNAVTGATGYKVKYDTVSGGSVPAKDFTKDADNSQTHTVT